MDRWQAMKVFVKVAETGGFAAAARHLHMSPPAVTRTISSLEETIGVRLLTRTTRAVKLTEAGSRYLEDCRRILTDIADAEASAAGLHAAPSGDLRVTGPAMFGQMHIVPILLAYLEQYPSVTVHSVFVDRVVNIIDEGMDVAIRIGHLPASGLSAAKVGSIRRVVCGAPSYLEMHGIPRTPADLARHRIIAPTAAWTSLEWQFGQEKKPASRFARACCATPMMLQLPPRSKAGASPGFSPIRSRRPFATGASRRFSPSTRSALCRSTSCMRRAGAHRRRSERSSILPLTTCAPIGPSTEAGPPRRLDKARSRAKRPGDYSATRNSTFRISPIIDCSQTR